MRKSTMFTITFVALLISTLGACAGGSRGTGVRYNRSADPTEFSDKEDDSEDDERENRWPWR